MIGERIFRQHRTHREQEIERERENASSSKFTMNNLSHDLSTHKLTRTYAHSYAICTISLPRVQIQKRSLVSAHTLRILLNEINMENSQLKFTTYWKHKYAHHHFLTLTSICHCRFNTYFSDMNGGN